MSQSFSFRKKKRKSLEKKREKKKLSSAYIFATKKIYINMNEFHLMRRVSLHYFYSLSY